MYDFDGLVNEVLRHRPEMTRDEITELIQEKKRNVGGGYLTDQGALFLIAGELGVQLKHMTSTDLTLKDLYVGANDITIVARVLAVYPISEFKKKDGGVGKYRRINLFDRTNVVRLTVWEDNPDAIKLEGISENSPVRISNGYVKQGLDGKPNLNVGKRGRIELLGDQDLVAKLTPLVELSRKLDEVGDDVNILALEGVAASNSRTSSFAREDGSQGSLMQFDVSGEAGGNKTRIVIWNPVTLPEVKPGQKLMVTNLRVKKTSGGERELHGDNGSVVRVAGVESPASLVFIKVSQVKGAPGPINLEVMALSKVTVSEVSLREGGAAKKAELMIGDDTGEITIIGWRETAERLAEISVGQKVRMLGVTRQVSRMGVEMLQLEAVSKIEKL
jgi:ssDNA-binding replication factor A large subunit